MKRLAVGTLVMSLFVLVIGCSATELAKEEVPYGSYEWAVERATEEYPDFIPSSDVSVAGPLDASVCLMNEHGHWNLSSINGDTATRIVVYFDGTVDIGDGGDNLLKRKPASFTNEDFEKWLATALEAVKEPASSLILRSLIVNDGYLFGYAPSVNISFIIASSSPITTVSVDVNPFDNTVSDPFYSEY